MSDKKNHNSKTEETPEETAEIRDVLDDSAADSETADVTVDEAEGMQQKIDELTVALEKEKKEYLFLRADFDNYRKRMLRDREELLRNAAEKVLKGLLPIVDDFERGLEATKTVDNADSVREGMELIYNKLIKYLADNGVKAMESTGAPFDPDFHEAIATIPAPSDDLKGKVVDTTQRGYMLNDKVLRHAKVAVGE
ncbi:MAG: nucleotide exchange factor GrpE [Bacteroidales bacterium]|nr:nucleotide exchange factor GrpE [Bacteroidales bacterium]